MIRTRLVSLPLAASFRHAPPAALSHYAPLAALLLHAPLAALLVCAAVREAGAADACGNGVLNKDEQCDDGNRATGDGCNVFCGVEGGWACTGSPSVCAHVVPKCGNGVINFPEGCDDGNTVSGDGCQANCLVQAGYSCSGTPSVCLPGIGTLGECGDGIVDDGEGCDDGDTVSGDGCQSDCTVQSGYHCTGEPSVCSALTGECSTNADCPDLDGIDCVHPICGSAGQCTTRDDCTEICREPQFWASRATNGSNSQSLIGIVLDDVGSLSVCGRTIDSATVLDDADSAVEGLCVKTSGIEQRELYRALVATALNCVISEGGTCDDILSRFIEVSFSDCDAICQDQPLPGGPTSAECIDQLECFNSGGRMVNGDCATGTCQSDPSQVCGGAYGSCSGFVGGNEGGADQGDSAAFDEDDDDACVPFAGNCADHRLCNTSTTAGAQLCVSKLVSSNKKACRDAKRNECTIDSCE